MYHSTLLATKGVPKFIQLCYVKKLLLKWRILRGLTMQNNITLINLKTLFA